MTRLEEIIKRFCYDRITGEVMAIIYYGRPADKPRKAGWKTDHGYIRVQCGNKQEYAHVVAWAIHYGEMPKDGFRVDHINRDRSDNSIKNLRLVDGSEHCANRGMNKSGKSGRKGVTWNKRKSMWQSAIQFRGERMTRLFHSIDDAAKFYDSCAETLDSDHFAKNSDLV